LVGLLFSAIVAERRREVGVLRAIGARRSFVASMLIAEAGLITGFGGLLGLLIGGILLFAFQNSLVYYLQTLHVDFAWPPLLEVAAVAAACAVMTALVGIVAAAIPASRASAEEPYALILREEARC